MNQLFLNDVYLSREDLIEKLNLSRRSFNALTRIDIRTVGEVLRLVELGSLRTIRGLGRKSILEIESKLAQVKFDGSEVESLANTDAIPDRNYLYLSREDLIEKLNLSRRSFNALTRIDIRTVGEVLRLVELGSLRTIRGLGRKSILEIESKLAQVKFDGSEVESLMKGDEIPGQVIRWQSQLVSKQLSIGLLHEHARIADRSIKDWLAAIEAIESRQVYEVLATILGSSLNICEEIEFLCNQVAQQRYTTVLLSKYSFEPKTLAQTGGELGISRERVRQIGDELKYKLSDGVRAIVRGTSISDLRGRPALLRIQSALLIAGDLGLDITYEGWTQRIRSSGLVGDWTSQDFVGTDAVEVMIAICNLLDDCKIHWLQMPENLQYAVQLATTGTPNIPAKILHACETLTDEVKKLIEKHTKNSGGVHGKWLSQEIGMVLEKVEDILHGLEYRVLSEGWFVPKVPGNPHQISYHDVFHHGLRKMFWYCGPVSIDDICAGIRHVLSRSGFPVPPPDVMAEILRIDGYQCEDELYYWEGTYDEKRNAGETVIMNCLEQIGPVLYHSELVHAFIESDLSFPTLHATLNYSPLFDKIESALYKLRGREVTYQDIERAKAAREPQSLSPEVEYDTGGNVTVSFTISAIAVGSGTVFCERFPNLSGDDWKCYVHGERAGELNATGNEFRRLKKPFELLNCQPGERLKFIFNTWERTVTIEKEGRNAKG